MMNFSSEANMRQARRWASVALSGLVAASLCLAAPGPARAASGGTEVLDWNVSGSVEAGGIYSFGERGSSKFNEYRDMDNGFVGELTLRGEKKDQPYFFELGAKNPARDDQLYEGAFGQYGMFRLDLGWDRTPHVLSNNAQTIFQQNGSDFTLPATLRNKITTTPAGYLNGTAANCNGTISWTCPYPVGSNTAITKGNSQYNFIRDTINGLLRPVDLGFNTDEGFVGLKLTPTEALRFDVEYNNRRSDGYRAMGAQINSVPVELAIPIDNMTHEVKFGAEFARPAYAIQFNYTASIFENEYQSYTWDSPLSTVSQSGNGTRTAATARGEVSAPPDNMAHTFNLTGRGSLPWWRTSVSGAFSYTMLRQDEAFLNNIAAPGTGLTQRNTDDAGRNSPDAKANLVSGNILLTSRPFNSVTATARYRYFEYQNDTPVHTFTNVLTPSGLMSSTSTVSGTTTEERFTKQNAAFDLGWRPIRQVSLKGGYEYEHWNRGDFDDRSFSTEEQSAKAAVDVTPIDWLLGRVTYTYGVRNLDGNYGMDPASGPMFYKFNYADRVRNRVDLLLQFSPWETFTPSFNFGYANDNFNNSAFGLTDDENLSAGVSLGWSPMGWLTLSADYTYERHNSTQRVPAGTTGFNVNDFESKSKDEFHTVGVGAVVDVVPKKFDINLGYGVTFGYTTIKATNLNAGFTSAAGNWDKIQNVLQTVKIVGRYRLTEKLSVRGGFAYERYNERNFLRDPMQPFMGYYDTSCRSGACGSIQSVWLGATTPNYESYTLGCVARYDF
jgi:MtrB/PioB family decaheme-associated outer membrane protein